MFYPDADIEFLPEVIHILLFRLKTKLGDDIQIQQINGGLQIVYPNGKRGPIFSSIKDISSFIELL